MQNRKRSDILDDAVLDVKEPLHSKLRQQLRRIILTNFEHNQRFYSERELLRKFKLSQLTVRRALTDLVREGYLTTSARRGFFVCKKPETKSVGVFIPAQPNEAYGPSRILDVIASECRVRDYALHVYYTHENSSVEGLIEGLRGKQINERLLLCRQPMRTLFKLNHLLEKAGYVTVALGSGLESEYTGSFVGIDHDQEANLLIDHLLELGHQRILFLSQEPETMAVTGARLNAINRRMRGKDLRQARIISCGTALNQDSFKAAYLEMPKIVNLKPCPTAIMPLSSNGTWAALKFLLLNNFKIPAQFSLVCFDDHPGNDRLPVSLTSVCFELNTLVEQALDSLWGTEKRSQISLVKSHLIVRESTGPAPP